MPLRLYFACSTIMLFALVFMRVKFPFWGYHVILFIGCLRTCLCVIDYQTVQMLFDLTVELNEWVVTTIATWDARTVSGFHKMKPLWKFNDPTCSWILPERAIFEPKTKRN